MAEIPDGKPVALPEPLPRYSATTTGGGGGGPAVTSVVRRWKREDLLERSPLILRALASLFSFLSFVLLVSNKHGDWMEFDRYEEYRYLVAISALAFVYSLAQTLSQLCRFRGGSDQMAVQNTRIGDFIGDQLVSYLLISALSAAIPITNRMRTAVVNVFTDSTAASISMAFFAFLSLGFSAIVSGFKLSKQTYI
ncbi:hypothetical protein LUZ60_013102 [Juncus effusus]|nr:hypothetical protein LUZ60_013102 [Juncus effusus]